MKSVNMKLLALVLAALMVLPMLAACGAADDSADTTGGVVTEGATDRVSSIEKKTYDKEFTAIYCADTFNPGYFFVEEDEIEMGNDLEDKLYERMLNVEEHLGVDIIAQNGGSFQEYTVPLKTSVSAGDDTYQMVMTHVYMEVANLITSNYFRDFNDFDSMELEADYWNYDLMESLSINDKLYCGYNDFCLANCYLIGFNKQMVKDYAAGIGDLYEQVRNKQWTLDKLIEYSSLVSADNGDGTWDDQDTYGFACHAWVPLISFQHASNIPIVKRADDGEFYISPMKDNEDKIVKLDEMLYDFVNAEYTYTWVPNSDFQGPTTQLHLKSNRVMFEIINNYSLVTTKEDEVKVGVLPYPLWDTKQEKYQTLNWNGVLGIPTTVQNDDMVGDVIELLAWYSDPVTTAFYETLLGAKVADAPEDVEMLQLIWEGQVSDIGLVFSSSSPQMDCILYAIPHHITAARPAYATYYKQNQRSAEKLLNKMFETKE
jgi:ABC-type glycerol-3-phosphate transport system substrate-binding protein